MLKSGISDPGLRSNAEREFMQMNETHNRIREEFLAAPPEQATACWADEEIKLKLLSSDYKER
jgi:hypothetical protein